MTETETDYDCTIYPKYFKYYLCDQVISDQHKRLFKYRIGYLLIPLFYLIILAIHYFPLIAMFVAKPENISSDKSCDLYKSANGTEIPILYLILIPIYEFFNLIFYILAIGLTPLYYWDMIKSSTEIKYMNMNMWIGYLQAIIVAAIVIIMIYIQFFSNGVCLKPNIIVHCGLGVISWFIVGVLSMMTYSEDTTKNQWQYFKFFLWQEVVSDNHRFWFRRRIGYLIILLTHIILVASQYAFIIVIIVLYGSENTLSILIFSFISFIDVILHFMFINATPFYYMDMDASVVLNHSDREWMRSSIMCTCVKTISIVIANVVQALLVKYTNYQSVQLFIPIIVYILIWITIQTVYYGARLIRAVFARCLGRWALVRENAIRHATSK
jgi:hypothetical protein